MVGEAGHNCTVRWAEEARNETRHVSIYRVGTGGNDTRAGWAEEA